MPTKEQLVQSGQDPIPLGSAVKVRRRILGMDVTELAGQCGDNPPDPWPFSQTFPLQIEHGRFTLPIMVERLASAFYISPSRLTSMSSDEAKKWWLKINPGRSYSGVEKGGIEEPPPSDPTDQMVTLCANLGSPLRSVAFLIAGRYSPNTRDLNTIFNSLFQGTDIARFRDSFAADTCNEYLCPNGLLGKAILDETGRRGSVQTYIRNFYPTAIGESLGLPTAAAFLDYENKYKFSLYPVLVNPHGAKGNNLLNRINVLCQLRDIGIATVTRLADGLSLDYKETKTAIERLVTAKVISFKPGSQNGRQATTRVEINDMGRSIVDEVIDPMVEGVNRGNMRWWRSRLLPKVMDSLFSYARRSGELFYPHSELAKPGKDEIALGITEYFQTSYGSVNELAERFRIPSNTMRNLLIEMVQDGKISCRNIEGRNTYFTDPNFLPRPY